MDEKACIEFILADAALCAMTGLSMENKNEVGWILNVPSDFEAAAEKEAAKKEASEKEAAEKEAATEERAKNIKAEFPGLNMNMEEVKGMISAGCEADVLGAARASQAYLG